MNDAAYMERALTLALKGRGSTSPNPMVGAVVVAPDGTIVGEGFHQRAGGPHAEVLALGAAGTRARGATLYCTLEPCCHHGMTGPCAPRIVEAGVSRVVAATEDPYPLVNGRGFAFLRDAGVSLQIGPGCDAAIRLNQPFFTLTRQHRPFVTLKAAISLDDRMAAAPGQRTRLTSAAANRHQHQVRAEVDAIGVGVGTVIADDPVLTARGVSRRRPLVRVIFDRRLRTPAGARVLSTREAGPVIIVTTPEGSGCLEARTRLENAGAEIEVARDESFRAALERLGARRVGSLLLEGGARVHEAAWNEDLVDFVRLYVTPHVLGESGVKLLGGRPWSPDTLVERRVERLAPDVMIEGYVHGPR